jgi:hypothetical protein
MVLLFQNGALPLRFGFASLAHIVTFLRRGLIKNKFPKKKEAYIFDFFQVDTYRLHL